ncbi:MAG: helix-turn-helix domain-containing protein [Gammaproteobacteria bacterium]|nr:helix-turn-helix domain-containing protein [Gammaproteobacteria bacterium]
MAQHPHVVNWTSEDCPIVSRYDAWVGKLNEAFGRWNAIPISNAGFFAAVKSYDDNLLKIVECTCDPCSATRCRRDIASDAGETLTVQMVLQGRESINFNGEQILLNAGDLLVWDSTKPMHFNVEQRLHKISVVLPLQRFRCWFPKSWSSIRRWIDGHSGDGRLLANYIESLSGVAFKSGCNDDYALIDATICMLANALEISDDSGAVPLRETQLRFVKEYINANIREPSLSPASIARATNMSLRYLHWLFKSSEETVTEYIIRNRLEHCVRDISNPKMLHRKLADIAMFWGFSDATHFSKRFKQEFAISPKAYRPQVPS